MDSIRQRKGEGNLFEKMLMEKEKNKDETKELARGIKKINKQKYIKNLCTIMNIVIIQT